MKINRLKDAYTSLPDDYKSFLSEGNLILENTDNYLIFYQGDGLIQFNEELDNDDYFPNLFFIAKNELSNAVVYDLRDFKLYSIPFIADEEDAELLADSFTDFLEKFKRQEIEIY